MQGRHKRGSELELRDVEALQEKTTVLDKGTANASDLKPTSDWGCQ
jgi:hypothetical protein